MRRGLLTATLLGVMFTVSACSGNKDVVSDESSELLAKPDVTQASAKGLESGSADSDSALRGNLRKSSLGIWNCIFLILQKLIKKEALNM